MKMVAFDGRARKDGNTSILIRKGFEALGWNMAFLLNRLRAS